MSRALPPLAEAWDAAVARYASMNPCHELSWFNVDLLVALRPRWGTQLRVDTGMFRLLFTRPHEHHYDESTAESVQVEREDDDRVRMALIRRVPRRALDQPGGSLVVTGDFTRPENALPAVEALLSQIAEPVDR